MICNFVKSINFKRVIMKAKFVIKILFALMVSFNLLQQSVIFAETEFNECSSEALRAFFPEKYVLNSLKKFNVPEDKWAAICEALHSKEQTIINQIESKAAGKNSDLFKDPSQQKLAVQMFKDTILENTISSFNANGIRDEKQIRSILDDIQVQKTQQFQECIKKHKLPFMPEKNTQEVAPNKS